MNSQMFSVSSLVLAFRVIVKMVWERRSKKWFMFKIFWALTNEFSVCIARFHIQANLKRLNHGLKVDMNKRVDQDRVGGTFDGQVRLNVRPNDALLVEEEAKKMAEAFVLGRNMSHNICLAKSYRRL